MKMPSAPFPIAAVAEARGEQLRAGSYDVAIEAHLHYLRLKLGAHHVRLNNGEHVLLIYLQDAVHAPQVQDDDAFRSEPERSKPTGREGLALYSVPVAGLNDSLDLLRATRAAEQPQDGWDESHFDLVC